MKYIDGFLLPVPRKNLSAYRRMARKAGRLWREHGALEYRECVGDDLKPAFGLPFPKLMRLKAGEVAVFSYIAYRSRAHRDRVNARVMKDPRLAACGDPKNMPFDCSRICYGGFATLVEA